MPMENVKELVQKYMEGSLTEAEREQLMSHIQSDQSVDEWLRTSITTAEWDMPEKVHNRVISDIIEQNKQ